MIVQGDWSLKGTKEYLSEQLRLNIRDEGWFKDNYDTVLVTRLVGPGNLFRATVWAGLNPREDMQRLLELDEEVK